MHGKRFLGLAPLSLSLIPAQVKKNSAGHSARPAPLKAADEDPSEAGALLNFHFTNPGAGPGRACDESYKRPLLPHRVRAKVMMLLGMMVTVMF